MTRSTSLTIDSFPPEYMELLRAASQEARALRFTSLSKAREVSAKFNHFKRLLGSSELPEAKLAPLCRLTAPKPGPEGTAWIVWAMPREDPAEVLIIREALGTAGTTGLEEALPPRLRLSAGVVEETVLATLKDDSLT